MTPTTARSRPRPEQEAQSYTEASPVVAADAMPVIRPITREELAVRAITREELDRHIARAEALRHAAYAAASAALGRGLRRLLLWTGRALRPNWRGSSTGGPRHGKCRA